MRRKTRRKREGENLVARVAERPLKRLEAEVFPWRERERDEEDEEEA